MLLVLSAVRGMVGISLGPWLGEVAVSGEAGVSITRADLGKYWGGEAGVFVRGEVDEDKGGVAV